MTDRISRTPEQIYQDALKLKAKPTPHIPTSRGLQPPPPPSTKQPPRSISPSPESVGGIKVDVQDVGKFEFRKPLVDKIKSLIWPLIIGALGVGGGTVLVAPAKPPTPPVEAVSDPCPPNQSSQQITPLCRHLKAVEDTANSMAWDVDDTKRKLSRATDRIVSLEGEVSEVRAEIKKSMPRVEGLPKQPLH